MKTGPLIHMVTFMLLGKCCGVANLGYPPNQQLLVLFSYWSHLVSGTCPWSGSLHTCWLLCPDPRPLQIYHLISFSGLFNRSTQNTWTPYALYRAWEPEAFQRFSRHFLCLCYTMFPHHDGCDCVELHIEVCVFPKKNPLPVLSSPPSISAFLPFYFPILHFPLWKMESKDTCVWLFYPLHMSVCSWLQYTGAIMGEISLFLPSYLRQKPPNIHFHVPFSTGTVDPKDLKRLCWLGQTGISMVSSMRENQMDYSQMHCMRLLVFNMILWSKHQKQLSSSSPEGQLDEGSFLTCTEFN